MKTLSAAAILCTLLGPVPAGADTLELAADIIRRADLTRGLCAEVGGEGDLSIQLARESELLVHVCCPDAKRVAGLRSVADEAGFDIQRLAVERGSLDRLPYADNTVDLVVCAQANPAFRERLPAMEVLRAGSGPIDDLF